MKKVYNTPSISVMDVETQQIIAISQVNGSEASQSLNNVETEGGEMGAADYRSGLWQ